MEVGGSSDDSSSSNKRKLGSGTATGSTSSTTGSIADGNSSGAQHVVSTSDQQATKNKASNSLLANPPLSTSTVSSPGPQAHSSETAPKARFKIGTTGELAQEEGSGSKHISPRFADSQLGGVTACLNNEEGVRGEHPTRS